MKPSEALRRNLRAHRGYEGLTQEAMGLAMSQLGFDWNSNVVSAVEAGRRRVTVDELVGLSLVVGAHPETLLAPMWPIVTKDPS